MLLSNTAGLSFLLGVSCYSPTSSACHLFISLKAMQMSYNKLPHKHWWLKQQNIFIHGSSVRKSKIKALVGLAPSTVFWEVSFFFFFKLLFLLHLFVFCLFQLLPGFLGLWPHLSSLCLRLHVAFCAMCVSESCFSHGIQPLTSLPLTHFIFLPSSCPSTPPSICAQLCSGRPRATQTGRTSSLKTHSLVIINNFTVFYEVIGHCCAHPPQL